MTPATFTSIHQRLGLSRAAFARELGCARNTANKYAAGTTPIPRYIALACAALLYGLKPPGEEPKPAETWRTFGQKVDNTG